jgi:hypothetical protein
MKDKDNIADIKVMSIICACIYAAVVMFLIFSK